MGRESEDPLYLSQPLTTLSPGPAHMQKGVCVGGVSVHIRGSCLGLTWW